MKKEITKNEIIGDLRNTKKSISISSIQKKYGVGFIIAKDVYLEISKSTKCK